MADYSKTRDRGGIQDDRLRAHRGTVDVNVPSAQKTSERVGLRTIDDLDLQSADPSVWMRRNYDPTHYLVPRGSALSSTRRARAIPRLHCHRGPSSQVVHSQWPGPTTTQRTVTAKRASSTIAACSRPCVVSSFRRLAELQFPLSLTLGARVDFAARFVPRYTRRCVRVRV
ncbi:hypothetical protein AB1N83_012426 [Pleurotus pulmonarius]